MTAFGRLGAVSTLAMDKHGFSLDFIESTHPPCNAGEKWSQMAVAMETLPSQSLAALDCRVARERTLISLAEGTEDGQRSDRPCCCCLLVFNP